MQLSVRSSLPSLDLLPVAPPSGRRLSIVAKPEPLVRNHLFANNIRFWSMVGIIVVHCVGAGPWVTGAHWALPLAFATIFKFGTIGFFVVSGFLMGERVEHCKPMEYFLRRTNRIFYSWLFWVAVYIALIASAALLNSTRSLDLNLIQKTLYSDVGTSLFHSAYWFVPNFLVSIGILLIFRRYLYSLKFGICLLALSLVYVVNIYALWFPSLHTQAIFGFVFYLWLGSYIARNFQRFNQAIARIPISVLAILTVATVVLSFSESCLLRTLHNPDPTNTLRASNQLFSLCVVLLLFKFTRATWPRFIDVRRYTFGLYLAHTVVIFFILGGLKFVFRHFHLVTASNLQYLCLATVFTFATYFGSLGVTAWIARKPALQWIIGIKSQDPTPASIGQTLDSPALVRG